MCRCSDLLWICSIERCFSLSLNISESIDVLSDCMLEAVGMEIDALAGSENKIRGGLGWWPMSLASL
jgi:hypothetical protein